MSGYGSIGGATAWEPSVKFLLVLLVAEVFIVAGLRAYTKHGG